MASSGTAGEPTAASHSTAWHAPRPSSRTAIGCFRQWASRRAVNFQPSGATTASITGDFALTSGEVEAVAGALRSNGIDVTAMHQHHLFEQPRLLYMHFWANGDPATLAQGLRAALDQTNSATQLAPVAAVIW